MKLLVRNIKKRAFACIIILLNVPIHAYDIYYYSTNPNIRVGIACTTTLAGCENKVWRGTQGGGVGGRPSAVIDYSGWCSGATWKYVNFYVTNSKNQNKEIGVTGIAGTAGDIYLLLQEDPNVKGNYILYRARESACTGFKFFMRYSPGNMQCDTRTGDWHTITSIRPADYQ